MKFNLKFVLMIFMISLIPLISAYDVDLQINSNVADFNTDSYKCTDAHCGTISFYDSVNSGTKTNLYSLIGNGDNYYSEYDYKQCYVPHIYINHVFGDYTNTEVIPILFTQKLSCKGEFESSSLSKNEIVLGESFIINANINSAFSYPNNIPTTTKIPDNIKDEYSSKTKVSFYANGIKIDETEAEILLASDKDFEFEWTPSSAGTYEITAKSEITDCACASQNTQEFLIGTLVVNEPPEPTQCTIDSNCGTNGFIGDNFCEGTSVFRNFKTFTCLNPGTAQSSCSSSTTKQQIQTCADSCLNGACVDETIVCHNNLECNDNNSNTTDICVNPNTINSYCEHNPINETGFPIINLIAPINNTNTTNPVNFTYTVTSDSVITSCSLIIDNITRLTSSSISLNTTNLFEYNPSIGTHNWFVSCTNVFDKTNVSETRVLVISQSGSCTTDSQCGSEFYSNEYCSSDNVYKDKHDFSCVSGGCIENITKELVEECDYGCSSGSCKEENDNGNGDNNKNNDECDEYYEDCGDENLFTGNIISSGNYTSLEPIGLGSKTTDESNKTNISCGFWLWFLIILVGILLLIILISWILK